MNDPHLGIATSADIDPLWCCPGCHGSLRLTDAGATCQGCQARYRRVGPVLDLRLSTTLVDFSNEIEQAWRLWDATAASGAEAFIRRVFSERPGWDERRVAYRTRQILLGAERYRPELRGWLAPAVGEGRPFLDVGCGAGNLLAAAASERIPAIGIDASLVWLMAAHLMVVERGGEPHLAAAFGQSLPLRDGTVGGVVSLDVIEHVGDVPGYLREIARVTAAHGYIAFATPNRYSVAPEPHVGLLGVGWLPRRWQQPYVRWRIADPYDSVSLMSARELGTVFKQSASIDVRIEVPPIPDEEIRFFGRGKAWMARTYNRWVRRPMGQQLFRRFGAFLRVTGRVGSLVPELLILLEEILATAPLEAFGV